MENHGPIRGRLRLWLQGERAMGLGSVPLRRDAAFEAQAGRRAAGNAKPPPPPPPPEDKPVVQARKTVASLFVAPENQPFQGPELPREQKIKLLKAMDDNEVKGCPKCRLSQIRTHTVFGEGDPDADIFFIGEAPGEKEDQTGRPFVGPAGHKLDEMIAAMGLTRQQVYIANIVKCRPPGNRVPAPDEIAACTPYLERQLDIIRPKVIVTLGVPATRYITKLDLSLGRLRGRWHTYRGIKVMPTYHPSYILRNYNVETRRAVWSDLKKVMTELALPGKPAT